MCHRSDYDVFVDYVENNNPINITVEGRIAIVYGGDGGDSGSGSGPGIENQQSFIYDDYFCLEGALGLQVENISYGTLLVTLSML